MFGMRLAIHAPNLCLSLPDHPFGKDVANHGLYRALATHGGFEQISFCTPDQPPLDSLQQQFGAAPGAARLTFRRSRKRMPLSLQELCSAVSHIFPSWPGSGVIVMTIRLTAW